MDAMKLYEARLKKSGRRALLAQELALEDRYHNGVFEALATNGMPPQMIDRVYRDWRAFCGGGAELLQAVDCAAGTVRSAALETGAQVPAFFCGLWPDPAFNASNLRTPHGNVVYVNTGLLVALRCLTQEVANAVQEMLVGEVGAKSREASQTLGALLARHLSGDDIRHDYTVRVLAGPPELLRREMMWGALCYAIAHEAGHLARCRRWRGGWADDNGAFQVSVQIGEDGYLALPQDESQAADGHSAEDIADDIATSILRQRPCTSADGVSLGFLLGAMSVPLLQAATWWRLAALTDRPLGWVHPYPDLRAAGVGMHLGETTEARTALVALHPEPGAANMEPSELEQLAGRFRRWAERVLAIDQCRDLVHKKGLGNRGLSPESLMMIYATDPAMPTQGSDIVAGLRGQK